MIARQVRFPSFAREVELGKEGYLAIAGVDEVGRGALAGPVVAAAVVLQPGTGWLSQLRDSKKLSARKREGLSAAIHQGAIAVGIGSSSPMQIDRIGIAAATDAAMLAAIEKVSQDFLLVDGARFPFPQYAGEPIVRGDNLSRSIAAASIVAKVYRDQLMKDYAGIYSGYGFERHKGYATPEHLDALCRLGVSPIHRRSFEPVRRAI